MRKQIWPPPIKHFKARNLDRCWVNGKWHYLGPSGSEESKAAYAVLLASISGGEVPLTPPRSEPPSKVLTVSAVLARWLAEGSLELTERGEELPNHVLSLQPLERLFAGLPAREFGPGHLLAVRAAMLDGSWLTAEERVRRRLPVGGWARQLVNQRINRIRSVWRWAELAQLVPEGRYAALAVVKAVRRGARGCREAKERQSPGMVAFKQVLRQCPPVVRSMLCVQWWSGMRPAELRTMRVGDVDQTARTYRPRAHKTDYLGHSRIVALGSRAWAALCPWLRLASKGGPDAYVFPPSRIRKHGHYTKSAWCNIVRRAADAAGVDGFVSYLCRHEARERVGKLAGDEAARAVLGHRTISTTLGYGRRVDHQYAQEVQRKIG